MKVNLQVALIAALLIGLSLSFATLGFTLFEADRSASVDIVGDDEGILTLTPGENTDVVFLNDDEALELDLSETDADGLNVDSTLEIGEYDEPDESEAFRITNTLEEDIDVTFEYDTDQEDGEVNLNIVDDGGDELGSFDATDEEADASFGLDDGEDAYVAFEFDSDSLDAGEEFSGDMSITAERSFE